MPKHTSRPHGAIALHEGSELRAVANVHKGEKRQPTQKMAIIIRAVQELHLMSSFFALLIKNPFETPPDWMALNNILCPSLR